MVAKEGFVQDACEKHEVKRMESPANAASAGVSTGGESEYMGR